MCLRPPRPSTLLTFFLLEDFCYFNGVQNRCSVKGETQKNKHAHTLFRRFSGWFLIWVRPFFFYSWKPPAYSGSFYLQLTILASLLTILVFVLSALTFLLANRAFLAYNGKVRLIRALRDCKQISLTVRNKSFNCKQISFPLWIFSGAPVL